MRKINITLDDISMMVAESVRIVKGLVTEEEKSPLTTMNGKEIIAIWELTKKFIENSLPHYITRNDYYIGDILSRHGFTVTNSIFGSCWFRKSNIVMHAHIDVDTGEWVLTEYIGLRGQATQIRYINPDENYELDIDQ